MAKTTGRARSFTWAISHPPSRPSPAARPSSRKSTTRAGSCIHAYTRAHGYVVALAVRKRLATVAVPDVIKLGASHAPESTFGNFQGTIYAVHKDAVQAQVDAILAAELPVRSTSGPKRSYGRGARRFQLAWSCQMKEAKASTTALDIEGAGACISLRWHTCQGHRPSRSGCSEERNPDPRETVAFHIPSSSKRIRLATRYSPELIGKGLRKILTSTTQLHVQRTSDIFLCTYLRHYHIM